MSTGSVHSGVTEQTVLDNPLLQNWGMDWLAFLDSHSGGLLALLTLVYVVATLLIFWSSNRSVDEMRRARLASQRPNIAVYLDSRDGGIAFLVVENKGASPAYHLRLRFPTEFGKKLDELHEGGIEKSPWLSSRLLALLERGSISLAPGQSLFFGAFPIVGQYDRYKQLGAVRGEAFYDWELERGVRSSFVVDFRLFEGSLVKPGLLREAMGVRKSLEKLALAVERIERELGPLLNRNEGEKEVS